MISYDVVWKLRAWCVPGPGKLPGSFRMLPRPRPNARQHDSCCESCCGHVGIMLRGGGHSVLTQSCCNHVASEPGVVFLWFSSVFP